MLYSRREKEFEQREKDREKERERLILREKERVKERLKEVEREFAECEKETLEDERKRRIRDRARDGRKRRFRDREKEEDEFDRKKEIEEMELSKRREDEHSRMQIDHHHPIGGYYNTMSSGGYYSMKSDIYAPYNPLASPSNPNMFSPSNEESIDPSALNTEQYNSTVGKKLGFGFSAVQNPIKKPRLTAAPGFKAVEEEDFIQIKKKIPLVPLDYDDDKSGSNSITGSPLSGSTNSEKKRLIQQQKSLIDKIPTTTIDLYAYPVNWAIVDEQQVVTKKMKPWVTRKILEYLGEEEASLIDFILSKISEHVPPKDIQDQLALVLEEEAEVFTVRLWRMLIFEVMRAENEKAASI